MTAFDDLVSSSLAALVPRKGFEAEFYASLLGARHHLHRLTAAPDHPRTRWIVAGALAGVVSATGVAYIAVRRHRGAA